MDLQSGLNLIALLLIFSLLALCAFFYAQWKKTELQLRQQRPSQDCPPCNSATSSHSNTASSDQRSSFVMATKHLSNTQRSYLEPNEYNDVQLAQSAGYATERRTRSDLLSPPIEKRVTFRRQSHHQHDLKSMFSPNFDQALPKKRQASDEFTPREDSRNAETFNGLQNPVQSISDVDFGNCGGEKAAN